MTENKNFTLVYNWNKADGWYGQNYRVMLLTDKVNKIGFTTKSEANKFKTSFKNYINKRFNFKIKNKNMSVLEVCDCITYKYMGSGPSYACTNYAVGLDDFDDFLK